MFDIKICGREESKIALGEKLLLDCISVLGFAARLSVRISDYMSTQMKFNLLVSDKTQKDLLVISVIFKLIWLDNDI